MLELICQMPDINSNRIFKSHSALFDFVCINLLIKILLKIFTAYKHTYTIELYISLASKSNEHTYTHTHNLKPIYNVRLMTA